MEFFQIDIKGGWSVERGYLVQRVPVCRGCRVQGVLCAEDAVCRGCHVQRVPCAAD